MRTNIIDDLRSLYQNRHGKIQKLLKDKMMKQICDAYFLDGLDYKEIMEQYGMTRQELHSCMIRACGIIIRARHRIDLHA